MANKIIVSDDLVNGDDGLLTFIPIGIQNNDEDIIWYPLELTSAFGLALRLLNNIEKAMLENRTGENEK